jgi:micrococcal nuclease
MFEYRGKVLDVHDGDTITVDIDLGLDVQLRGQKVRLRGIQSPELNTDEGKAAQRYLEALLKDQCVLIRTFKDRREKFGRYLAEVCTIIGDSCGEWASKLMVENGHAVPWDGKGPRPRGLPRP